uniref:Ovule protein n=1 Tax=Syphacia muris TaxID=451379 RepID=A0A0N5AFY8_9BILA
MIASSSTTSGVIIIKPSAAEDVTVTKSDTCSVNGDNNIARQELMANSGEPNDEADKHITTNSKLKSKKKHSKSFGGSFKMSKFWIRIFLPWKWRKRTRKDVISIFESYNKILIKRANSDCTPEKRIASGNIPSSVSSFVDKQQCSVPASQDQ